MRYGNFFTTKEWVNYKQYHEHLDYVKKPDHSFTGECLTTLRQLLLNHPKAMQVMRKLQNRFKIDF